MDKDAASTRHLRDLHLPSEQELCTQVGGCDETATAVKGDLMGWVYAHNLKKVGDYLLGVLARESAVPYSRFYDGSDETADALCRACGFDTHYSEEVACRMDDAVGQLQAAGLVKTTELSQLLSDGTHDYRIEITPLGSSFLEKGEKFAYRDMDL
jgi:hypothetical protein